jgi:hypothetical protein
MPAIMPDLGSDTHVVSVEYASLFGGVTAQDGRVAFGVPNPVQFLFLFETGTTQPDPNVDLQQVSWDYSWFDQAQVEAGIAAALGAICQSIAGLLGLPLEQVESSVQVRRVWTIAPNQRGTGAPQEFSVDWTVTEVMPYPPAPAA